jgi:hypothetical protein
MTTDQIRKAWRAQPFKPFTLRTGGGREYEVRHPEMMLIIPPGRTLVIACDDGTAELVDLLLVESLHLNNGRKRRSPPRPGMS